MLRTLKIWHKSEIEIIVWQRCGFFFSRVSLSLIHLMIVCGLLGQSAHGQVNGIWNINANGNFSNSINWLNGFIPGTGGLATFNDFYGMSGSRIVTLTGSSPILSGITFDSVYQYNLSGGTISLNSSTPFNFAISQSSNDSPNGNLLGHTVSSVITGTSQSVSFVGPGQVTLSGINTFSAPITISGGAKIRTTNGDAVFGNASNTININGGTLDIRTTGLITNRAITIGSGGAYFRTLPSTTSFNGPLSGSGPLVTEGHMSLTGNNGAFTGDVRVDQYILTLSGSGTLGGTGVLDIAGSFFLNNNITNVQNRIADTRNVTLRGGNFRLESDAAAGTTENVGGLILASGSPQVSTHVGPGGGGATLRFNGLQRNSRSTVGFTGTSLGTTGLSNIVFTAAPGTLVGGGGTGTQVSILPFAWGSAQSHAPVSSEHFVTWHSGTGRIQLASSYAALGSATALDNVNVATVTSVNSGGQTINALRIGSTLNGTPTDVLTINSGAILITSASTITAPIHFGAAEGVIQSRYNTTINGIVSGTNGLTKGEDGNLSLLGANTYSGPTHILGGAVSISSDVGINTPSPFGSDSSPIVLHSGSSSVSGSIELHNSAGTVSIDREIFVLLGSTGYARLAGTSGANQLTIKGNIHIENPNGDSTNSALDLRGGSAFANRIVIDGIISGSGGIQSGDSSSVVLNGANTFTGNANFNFSHVHIGHDSAFGTGKVSLGFPTASIQSLGAPRTVANNFETFADLVFGGSQQQGTHPLTINGSLNLQGATRVLTVNNVGHVVTLAGNVFGGSIIKAGDGSLKLSNADNGFTGFTNVRNGTLVLAGDALYGSGVLGVNPNEIFNSTTAPTSGSAGTVILGDASTQPTNNLALMIGGEFTMARSIQVNSQNSGGATTLGALNSNGIAKFDGLINLNRGSTLFSAAQGGAVEFNGLITQSVVADINFVGSGTKVLTNANVYTGSTRVIDGTLLVNNTLGSGTGTGNVNVAQIGTLGGSGIIEPAANNSVVIDGTLAPGNSSGALTFGSATNPTSVTLQGHYDFELSIAGMSNVPFGSGMSSPAGLHVAHDLINVFGTLDLTGSTINIESLGSTGFDHLQSYSWLIGTTNEGTLIGLPTLGSISGHDFSSAPASNFIIGTSGGSLYLNFVAVPEPSSLVVQFVLGSFLLGLRRRDKKQGDSIGACRDVGQFR